MLDHSEPWLLVVAEVAGFVVLAVRQPPVALVASEQPLAVAGQALPLAVGAVVPLVELELAAVAGLLADVGPLAVGAVVVVAAVAVTVLLAHGLVVLVEAEGSDKIILVSTSKTSPPLPIFSSK